MRQPYKKQITIGSKNIKEIEFDLNCRHEIIPILIGLQRIYKKRRLLGEILDLIKQDVLGGKSENNVSVSFTAFWGSKETEPSPFFNIDFRCGMF